MVETRGIQPNGLPEFGEGLRTVEPMMAICQTSASKSRYSTKIKCQCGYCLKACLRQVLGRVLGYVYKMVKRTTVMVCSP